MHKALAKREAICQSSAQCARTLMHLLACLYPSERRLLVQDLSSFFHHSR
jgi:hypothetical protein